MNRYIGCKRSQELIKGCIVMMKSSSGLAGYGNPQCVSSVCEPLGTISLYGHNQHYKDYDIAEIIEYPLIEMMLDENGNRSIFDDVDE